MFLNLLKISKLLNFSELKPLSKRDVSIVTQYHLIICCAFGCFGECILSLSIYLNRIRSSPLNINIKLKPKKTFQ